MPRVPRLGLTENVYALNRTRRIGIGPVSRAPRKDFGR